jgi:hypothetical protein
LKEFRIILLLFALILPFSLHSESLNISGSISSATFTCDENPCYEAGEFAHDEAGDLPAPHVLYNLVPKLPTNTVSSEKNKKLNPAFVVSGLPFTTDPSFYKFSWFHHYSSVYLDIYLKTACFRL